MIFNVSKVAASNTIWDDSLTFREDKWWFYNFTGVSGEIDRRVLMDGIPGRIPDDCHPNRHRKRGDSIF